MQGSRLWEQHVQLSRGQKKRRHMGTGVVSSMTREHEYEGKKKEAGW